MFGIKEKIVWEYYVTSAPKLIDSVDDQSTLGLNLTGLGKNGWELITIVPSGDKYFYYLKRKIN